MHSFFNPIRRLFAGMFRPFKQVTVKTNPKVTAPSSRASALGNFGGSHTHIGALNRFDNCWPKASTRRRTNKRAPKRKKLRYKSLSK